MAEALGVAGSFVGFISLGIQVSQGLLSYYKSWENQDSAIAKLCRSLESLLETIRILDKDIKERKYCRSAKEIVQKNIKHVEDALYELDQQLKKVQGVKASVGKQATASQELGQQVDKGVDSGFLASMKRHTLKFKHPLAVKTLKGTKPTDSESRATKNHLQRALYPFREDTLKQIERTVSEARENLNLALQVLQQEVISDIHGIADKNKTKEILKWLSSKNFWLHQQELCQRRQDGTGQWLLKHPDFVNWVEGKNGPLWCLGTPGVGKTMLMSTVVEYLESQLPARNALLAFVYCDHKESLSNRLEYFLGAIIHLVVRQIGNIPEEVSNLYSKHCMKGTSITTQEYINLLQSLTKGFPTVYVVVDALDECVDDNGKPIWVELIRTLRRSNSALQLLYSSREIEDIAGVLAGSTRIEVEGNDDDIRSYIRADVSSRDYLADFCMQDAELLEATIEGVLSACQHTFLAARLHVDFLAAQGSPDGVKNALSELPPTLDRLYDEAIQRIERQRNRYVAFQVLEWIALAVRPLQVREIQHAMATIELNPAGSFVLRPGLPQQNFIINACAGLLQINEGDDTISLVHKTTQEYFDRNSTKLFPLAKRTMAATCLKYLSLDSFSEGPCTTFKGFKSRRQEYALFDYATENMGSYFYEENVQTWDYLAVEFLGDKKKLASVAQCLFQKYPFLNFPHRFSALHYAAYLGSTLVAKVALRSVPDNFSSRDSRGRVPLSYAAENGHEAVVELLLATGKAGINSKDYFGQTPLSYAAESGYQAVVELLLATGEANVDSKDNRDQTPLSHAAEFGHEAIVNILLVTGLADINLKDCSGQTPLSHAAESGYKAVVELLLATGEANVDSKDNSDQTPLSYAAENGHEAVVELLLATGKADIHSKDCYGQTPLSYATGEKHDAIVKLLLQTAKLSYPVNIV